MFENILAAVVALFVVPAFAPTLAAADAGSVRALDEAQFLAALEAADPRVARLAAAVAAAQAAVIEAGVRADPSIAFARRSTCEPIGSPPISCSLLPGNLADPTRAWTIATIFTVCQRTRRLAIPRLDDASPWIAMRSGRFVKIWNCKFGHLRTISHASSRHGSAASINQSDHEQVNTRSIRPEVDASRCQFAGAPQVFVRTTTAGSRPYRSCSVNI